MYLIILASCLGGIDEMYEIVEQTKYKYLGINEMYKIGDEWNIRKWSIFAKIEYEYSRIYVVSVLRA